jgi:HK97 family phage prohead protease
MFRTDKSIESSGNIKMKIKDCKVVFSDIIQIKDATHHGSFAAIITTDELDRDGEAIVTEGGDLSEYKGNPILLESHNWKNNIGTATEVTHGKSLLHAKFLVAKAHPKSEEVWNGIKAGTYATMSIGFAVKEERKPTPVDKLKWGDGIKNVVSKWKLIESSVVPGPANSGTVIFEHKDAEGTLNADVPAKPMEPKKEEPKEIKPETVEVKTIETSPVEVKPEPVKEPEITQEMITDMLKKEIARLRGQATY